MEQKLNMENAATKLRGSFVAAPVGAVAGAFLGYMLAKKLGYNKTFAVISFAIVGLITGAELSKKLK